MGEHMSDPVSKTVIEDVLSSIRRLVSEDSRIGPRRVVSRERVAQDKLVLTPALRVADDETSEGESESWIDEINALRDETGWFSNQFGNNAADEGAAPDGIDLVEAEPAETEREETGIAPEPEMAAAFEPDRVDDSPDAESGLDVGKEPWRDPEATLFASAREAGCEAVTERPDENDVIDPSDGGAAGEFQPRLHLDLVERESSGDLKGGEPADDPRAETDREADEGADSFRESISDDIIEPAEEGIGDGEALEEDFERRTENLTAKIKALEEAIGRSHEQFEPDGPGEDDYAGTPVRPIEWENGGNPSRSSPAGVIRGVFERETIAAQPEGMPEQDGHGADGRAQDGEGKGAGGDIRGMFVHRPPEPHASDDSREPVSVFDDEAVLDEESLRELVADIVRQELQGALGERITRNVRKLVRREIHRALAAKELE
ncbi:hypothetical protein [Jhaorihella thermophila]|uniref:Uncharacterized protein n=1 Tax=Jhaorihella thermophila TaxID=488547 RepID=A0A1H5W4M6_9RHOB|nr:hypothetical protein [Jhaorihella thermophila]SEF94442.1 hypothetical protein SAMN05421751_107109 [Jhaorihella thermophila]